MNTKFIIGLAITIIIYFTLNLFYIPSVVEICKINKCRISGFENSLWNSPTVVFCILTFILWALIARTKKNFKIYLITIGLTLLLICISLFINWEIIKNFTPMDMSLGFLVQCEINIDYRLLYLPSTIAIIPILLNQIAILFNFKENISQSNRHINIDYRVTRFIAAQIDVAFAFLIALFFSKIVVLYPETSLLLIIGYFYYIFTIEYISNTSIGKLIMGLKIISTKNNIPTSFKILLRTVTRIIPLYALSILFNRDGLHDFLSKTKVVRNE